MDSQQINDNISISNQISVVADAYIRDNFINMRWIEFMGAKWKATQVDASQVPRLIITLGDLWNEDET